MFVLFALRYLFDLCVALAPPFLSLLGSSSVISLSLGLSSYWCACALSLHSFHRLLEVLSSTCVAFDVHSVITRALSFSLSCFFSVFSVPSLLFMLSLPPPSSQILGPCQAVYSGVVCRTPLPCHDLFRWAGAPLARRIQSAPGILILGVRSPVLQLVVEHHARRADAGSDKGRRGCRAASMARVIRKGRGKRWRKRRGRRRRKKGKGGVLSGFKGRRVGDGGGRPASQPVSSA